jgi:ferredoxin
MDIRVTIDTERCEGHGRCVMLAPEVFDQDDDGHGIVVVDSIPSELEVSVAQAVASCPEGAISLARSSI